MSSDNPSGADTQQETAGSMLERDPLVVKAGDFSRFAEIVRSMRRKEHLTHDGGFERLLRLAFAMNAEGKQRSRTLDQVLAGSSETVRQARDSVMRQSDPHGDM